MSSQDTSSDGVRAALARIEDRLAALERRVSSLEGVEVLPEVATPVAPPAPPAPPTQAHIPPAPPPVPETKREVAQRMFQQVAPTPVYDVKPAPAPTPAPVAYIPPTTVRPAAAAPQQRSGSSLEATIGKNWAAWVGGLILFGGVLFFLKFAWDQGWLRMSPEMRLVIAFAAGTGLVGLGEFLHFRKMRVLAATLAAVGIAVVMSTFWAGHKVVAEPIFSSTTAFVGAAATGVIGVAIALQMNIISLAVLAVIGMYVSPMVLSSGQDNSLALMVYLVIVTGMSLALSFAKRRWWALRIVSFVFTWLWVVLWCAAAEVANHRELGLAIVGVFFMMFTAEAVAALHRFMRPDSDRPESPNTLLAESMLSALTFFNTAMAMICYAVVFTRLGQPNLWIVPLGLAAVTGLITFVTPSKPFSVSTAVQACAMLALAVPLYFEKSAITFAWAIYAAAFAVWAFASQRTFARIWATIMLGLTLGKLFTWDLVIAFFTTSPWLHQTLWQHEGTKITPWVLIAWGASIFAVVVAYLLRPKPFVLPELAPGDAPTVEQQNAARRAANAATFAHVLSMFCLVGGTVSFVAACTANLSGGPVWSIAVGLWVAALIGLARGLGSKAIEIVATVLLPIVMVKWFIYDALGSGVIDNWSAARGSIPPVANLSSLVMVLLCGCMLLIRNTPKSARAWLIALIVFGWLNVETLRAMDFMYGNNYLARQVALSVLWAIVGFGAVVGGFIGRNAAVRWTALALLGITAAKVLLVDMASLHAVLRVLSFMVVGVLLLAVSFAYHKFAKVFAGNK